MYAWTDPNWFTPRLQWMTDPQSFAPLLNAVNVASSVEPENMDGGAAESSN
jgi:hypothetical protein